ncbi:hypothetical protein ZHAS_00015808 [Anopheles sinensis]|uniref:Uncharacterized protein n=1 Tax=Anopheles sinensis TaxID=74873 RepID=A0A084WBZ7_ANOSI|nr:hypothetical protein ZHAS_00015808 [Anopheles sinensis]
MIGNFLNSSSDHQSCHHYKCVPASDSVASESIIIIINITGEIIPFAKPCHPLRIVWARWGQEEAISLPQRPTVHQGVTTEARKGELLLPLLLLRPVRGFSSCGQKVMTTTKAQSHPSFPIPPSASSHATTAGFGSQRPFPVTTQRTAAKIRPHPPGSAPDLHRVSGVNLEDSTKPLPPCRCTVHGATGKDMHH